MPSRYTATPGINLLADDGAAAGDAPPATRLPRRPPPPAHIFTPARPMVPAAAQPAGSEADGGAGGASGAEGEQQQQQYVPLWQQTQRPPIPADDDGDGPGAADDEPSAPEPRAEPADAEPEDTRSSFI